MKLKLTNERLINEWLNGGIRGYNAYLNSNGLDVFSRSIKIGVTRWGNDGKVHKYVFDYTKRSGNFISDLTSKHVEMLKESGAILILPDYQFPDHSFNNDQQ